MESKEEVYKKEFEELAELCREFLEVHEQNTNIGMLCIYAGMITAKCADIYNLDVPGGLIHPSTLFRKE